MQQLYGTACAIATLLGLAAVGVEDAIGSLCAGAARWPEYHRLVKTHAAKAVCQCLPLRGGRQRLAG